MVTREELQNCYKIKVLLKGPSGSGKTFTSIRIMKYIVEHNYKVLYLDFERGSVDEMLELDDNILSSIIWEEFTNYKELVGRVQKYHDSEEVQLIVIDQMPMHEIARLSTRDILLEQGFYYIGEKMKTIENKEAFDLRGYMYQLSNTYVMKFMNDLVRCNQDIICTLMTPNKWEDAYDGKFSIIFDMFTALSGTNIIYKAQPKKIRGTSLSNYPAIYNPWESLIIPFIKKYGSQEEIENARKEQEEKRQKIIEQQIGRSVNNEEQD